MTYQSIPEKTLLDMLSSLDLRNSRGEPLRLRHLEVFRELLEAGDWLVRNKSGDQWQVPEKYLEPIMRMAAQDEAFETWRRTILRYFPYKPAGSGPASYGSCLREFRFAFYGNRPDALSGILEDMGRYYPDAWKKDRFFLKVFSSGDKEFLNRFDTNIQAVAIRQLLAYQTADLAPSQALEEFLSRHRWFEDAPDRLALIYPSLFLPFVMTGRLETLASLTERLVATEWPEAAAWQAALHFFRGEHDRTLALYEEEERQQGVLRLTAPWPALPTALYMLSLWHRKTPDYLQKIATLLPSLSGETADILKPWISAAYYFSINLPAKGMALLRQDPDHPFGWLLCGAVRYWFEVPTETRYLLKFKDLQFIASRHGFEWLSMELSSLIGLLDEAPGTAADYREESKRLHARLQISGIVNLMQPAAEWERALDALLTLPSVASPRLKHQPQKETRIAWMLDPEQRTVQPVEQTFGRGGWSKGRPLALKRLYELNVDNMSERDIQAARAIRQLSSGLHGNPEYQVDFDRIVRVLVGHPYLFRADNPMVPVELVERVPELLIEQVGDTFTIGFSEPFTTAGLHFVRETPSRYLLLDINEKQEEINRLVRFGELEIPMVAVERLREVIPALERMVPVRTLLDNEGERPANVLGDPKALIQLLPVGTGYKLELFVLPAADVRIYCKPGKGRQRLLVSENGQSRRVLRSFEAERSMLQMVLEASPILRQEPAENEEWMLASLSDCLKVLLDLEPLRQSGQLVLEYPKGQAIRIAGTLGTGQLRLGIRQGQQWFDVSGTVDIDEGHVMDFRRLLELAGQPQQQFVEVGDGQFLALTESLRSRLTEWDTLMRRTPQALQVHPLAVHLLSDLEETVGELQVDDAWRRQLTRIHAAETVAAEPPAGFLASLRHYQLEGFQWLHRLADWGVGACLADDMGLGKTIQALALLVSRASAGPAMVVAPASVVRNWYHEGRKFAPGLRLHIFGEEDRVGTVRGLVSSDLLLVSYGLLQQESELLGSMRFSTIILDEAQAIKNRATKRSQAAMQLQADFRMVTTGTPIENHLGELWTLFQFLNPGLLGSVQQFNERFAVPIEREQDQERLKQLRRLIQPFLLRRRKQDVLQELPAKTEIVLTVELSAEERAFYEALRRKALEDIARAKGGTADKRFLILAELMRLRQAACHPRLIQPEVNIASSKLQLLSETVEELREEGHKALIFSQFVKHLKIVEDWVRSQGIPYQYLDGSTPLPQRDRAITAFQQGEGDVFLISLKAGGFGLNLTAADYVIHLDPWWNPAVEDQASDRAHRIGQQRPVTVYRMVSEDTIEEKIVQLHLEKRELADSLLEGGEMAGKLSAEELLALLGS
ncbi:MAG: hypothetical protein RLY31_2029 [Bacteroidota bacterium]